MISHAQGQLLAQIRPSVTTAVQALLAALRTEVTLIIASSGATAATYSIYQDDDGTTFDGTTLLFTKALGSGGAHDIVFQAQHAGSGIHMIRGGSLGVKSSVADAIVFSIYGVTETLAERVRGRD